MCPKGDFLSWSKALTAAQVHELGDVQLRVPADIPSHGSDVDLRFPDCAELCELCSDQLLQIGLFSKFHSDFS